MREWESKQLNYKILWPTEDAVEDKMRDLHNQSLTTSLLVSVCIVNHEDMINGIIADLVSMGYTLLIVPVITSLQFSSDILPSNR